TGGVRRLNIGSDGALTIDAVASHSAAGDWAFNTDTLYVDSGTKRVGIGDTTPAALLDVGGGTATYIDGTDDLLVKDDLEVNGQAWFDANASVSGKFEVLGNTTFGDADTDLLVVNADIASNLIPNDGTRYVGDANNRWAHGYFDELTITSMSAEGVDISGTKAETFTINSDNVTDDTEDAWLTFERGGLTNASLKWDSTNDRFDLNFPLIVSASLDVTGTFTADYVGIGTSPGAPYLLNVAADSYLQGTTYLGTTSTYFNTSGNLQMGGGTIQDSS
ncbi:unnamed protein product, partial [marine sediment metagenome]